MKNLFNDISQDERNRILEMHQSATKKNYLSEQGSLPQSGTTSDPIVPLLQKVSDVKGFVSQKGITSDEMVKYFGFPVINTINGEPPAPETYKSMSDMQKFLPTANTYYLNKKISPIGRNSLTTLFVNQPIIKQLTEKTGSTPPKFTKQILDKGYYNYLMSILS
jgi:hypothetical protein